MSNAHQPNYQQQPWQAPVAPPKKKGRGCLTGLGIAFALFIIIIIAAIAISGGTGDDTTTATTAESGQDTFAVGETAHTGDFDVTVHGVTDPFVPANEFDIQAAAGKRLVAIELTMTNTSAEPLPVSTALGVEVTDHMDRLGAFSLAGASELPRLDAPTVAPGEARRGWAVVEVAGDAADLMLRVKGNLTATGSLFVLS